MSRRTPFDSVWALLRVIVAAACVSAVAAQGIATVRDAVENGYDVPATVVNVFSFFTNLSALATAAMLAWAAARSLRHRGPSTPPPGLAVGLAAVTTYMVIVGAVYNVLLRGLPQAALVVWANETLHTVVPLFLVVDLLVGHRGPLRWRAVAWIILFPAAWLVYTFVRGPLAPDPSGRPDSWYPYPFLNPVTSPGGWAEVSLYLVGIAAAVLVVGSGVVAVTRWRAGRPQP